MLLSFLGFTFGNAPKRSSNFKKIFFNYSWMLPLISACEHFVTRWFVFLFINQQSRRCGFFISFLFEIIFLTFLRSPKNTWPVMRTTQEQRQHLIFQSLSDMILTCLVIGNKILYILGEIFFLIQPIIKYIHNHFHLTFPILICFSLLIMKSSNSSRYIHVLYNLVRHNIELLDIEIISLDGKAYIWVTIDIVVKKNFGFIFFLFRKPRHVWRCNGEMFVTLKEAI